MSHEDEPVDLILLGCGKKKRDHGGPARDVYASLLWKYRRNYAESRRRPWYILSAKHGLLAPGDRIKPYNLSLAELPAAKRRAWSARVLDRLVEEISELKGKTIEIHAGKFYVEYGLEKGLSEAGVKVLRPLEHKRQGQQLKWYKDYLNSSSGESMG